jgi:hypothetical protein
VVLRTRWQGEVHEVRDGRLALPAVRGTHGGLHCQQKLRWRGMVLSTGSALS